jgi:uncharacterized membrane protein
MTIMQRARRAFGKVFNEHFVETLVVAALVIITTMIAIHFITYKPERYTGFGLLNEHKEPGPFPVNVTLNEALPVYANVLNREGKTAQYMIRVVVGDALSTVNPATGVVGGAFLKSYEGIVMGGQDWEQAMSLYFNNTLVGIKKLFFELWMLDATAVTYRYTQQVLHVWIEILEP